MIKLGLGSRLTSLIGEGDLAFPKEVVNMLQKIITTIIFAFGCWLITQLLIILFS
jgi:hypothetical protein